MNPVHAVAKQYWKRLSATMRKQVWPDAHVAIVEVGSACAFYVTNLSRECSSGVQVAVCVFLRWGEQN